MESACLMKARLVQCRLFCYLRAWPCFKSMSYFLRTFFIVIAAMERGFRAELGGEAAVAACEFLGRDLGAVLLCIVVLSLALNLLRERLGTPAVSLRPQPLGFMVK